MRTVTHAKEPTSASGREGKTCGERMPAEEELEESSAASDGINSSEPTTLRFHRNLSVRTKVSLTSHADTRGPCTFFAMPLLLEM